MTFTLMQMTSTRQNFRGQHSVVVAAYKSATYAVYYYERGTAATVYITWSNKKLSGDEIAKRD